MKWKLFLDFMDDREKKWLKLDGTGAISQLLECFSCTHETRLGTQHCVKKNGCQNPGGWRASSVTWGHDARSSWIRETLLHRVNYKNLTAKDNSQTNTVIEYFFVLSIKVVFYYYPSHNRKFSFKKFLLVPEIFPRISIKSDCIFITVKKKTHKPDTKKQWFRKNLWT